LTKQILIPAGLVAGSVLSAVLLFEVILRVVGFSAPIWYRPDSHVGAVLRPGVEGWFEGEGRAYVRISSAGLRDREHSIEKPKDVYRLAVLGDSYSEAMQVDVKDAFWSVLEDKLTRCAYQPGKRIEVINFGVSGFGTAQEYLMLESAAMRYRPDLVLLQFMNGNDVTDNSIALNAERMRPYFLLDRRRELVLDASFAATEVFQRQSSVLMGFVRSTADYSRVLQMIRAIIKRGVFPRASADTAIEPGLKPAVLAAPRESSWEDAWAVTERLILAMNEYLERRGVPLVVVTTPFAIQVHPDRQVREGVISYGVSSYGYDIRVADEFRIFTNVNSTIVDPKQFDPKSFVEFRGDVCIIPPNSFALARSVEYFRIPRNVLTICVGKSTYARCGIIVNVTPFEPEWEGFVTLEISNTTPLPAKIYANEGLCQVIFFESDEDCEVSYKDKKGKYQSQSGIVLPRL